MQSHWCVCLVSVVQTWQTDVSVRCRGVAVVGPPLVSAVHSRFIAFTLYSFIFYLSQPPVLFLTGAAQSDASV